MTTSPVAPQASRFGFADALGAVVASILVVFIPTVGPSLPYPRLIVMAAGCLLILPVAAFRWWHRPRPHVWPTAIALAVSGFVLWAVISAVGSGAPVATSVMGSTLRGVGILALVCAATLLMGAATLTRAEVGRVLTWMLIATTAIAFIGLLQVIGLRVTPQAGVVATLGNTNFAAGAYAIVAPIALGRALTASRWAVKAWAGVLATSLVGLSIATDARQGPAAAAAGLAAFAGLMIVMYRGRARRPLLALLAGGTVIVASLVIASLFGRGPLTWLWSEWTFAARQQYWVTAWNMLQANPVFGSGPDGFGRVSARYWSEELARIHGPDIGLDTTHNIALHFGATLGWMGLALWLLIFGGIVCLYVARVLRAPVASPWLTASVGSALCAYLVQGMVSIDVLGLLALGWTIAGLAMALSLEPARGAMDLSQPPSNARIRLVGYALALVGLALIFLQLSAPGVSRPMDSAAAREAAALSAFTPCDWRRAAVVRSFEEDSPETSLRIAREALQTDPDCPRLARAVGSGALRLGDLDLADRATQLGLQQAPYESDAWALRGRYLLRDGDLPGARGALREAERLNSIYPTWRLRVDVALLRQELTAVGDTR